MTAIEGGKAKRIKRFLAFLRAGHGERAITINKETLRKVAIPPANRILGAMTKDETIQEGTFKRGQVEWALWEYFAGGRIKRASSPKIFATRIKRLLELDRSMKKFPAEKPPRHRFAFHDAEPDGRGIDASYSHFNAFCLAIGLDLLDVGFKQSEVVFLLKYVRADLERQFEWIRRNPVIPRSKIPAEDRPRCPVFEINGIRYADCRVFAVIEKIEVKEAFTTERVKVPLILEPIFCRGIEALRNELHTMNFDRRKVLVLELAHTVVMVSEFLEGAPQIQRGRR